MALSGFDHHAQKTLSTASAALGPMSSILLRTESASSSQIENLTACARQLALAELERSSSQNARIVRGNVHGMDVALQLADRLDEDAILAMQRILVQEQSGSEDYAGQCRDSLLRVGTSVLSPIGASHIAPQAEYIALVMQDLVEFMRRMDLPVLLQAALAHAQFETTHPFADDNGRTGRALIHALLKGKGLVTTTTAPLSAGLLKRTSAYFDSLTSFRDGEAGPLVFCFVEAALFAASSGTRLVNDLNAELAASAEELADLRPQASGLSMEGASPSSGPPGDQRGIPEKAAGAQRGDSAESPHAAGGAWSAGGTLRLEAESRLPAPRDPERTGCLRTAAAPRLKPIHAPLRHHDGREPGALHAPSNSR